MSNANEPAYPFPVLHGKGAPTGLTKREAFAMAAMQGLLPVCGCDALLLDRCAEFSVCYADALLAELAKAHP